VFAGALTGQPLPAYDRDRRVIPSFKVLLSRRGIPRSEAAMVLRPRQIRLAARTICLIAISAVGLSALQPAAGGAAFTGNLCTLVSAKEVASFGITTQCKPTTLNGPGFIGSTGIWGTQASPISPHLAISCNTYPSPSGPAWKVAFATLGTALPGKAKKVSGIGSLAYESGADGSTLSAINFVTGKKICNINMRTSKPLTSLAVFNALAKSVAAKL
jgi:hypothetical protein